MPDAIKDNSAVWKKSIGTAKGCAWGFSMHILFTDFIFGYLPSDSQNVPFTSLQFFSA